MHSTFLRPSRSPQPPVLPPSPWPMWARAMQRRRVPGERGVGDTLARVLAAVGAARAAKVYERVVGKTCGCTDRQAWLNARWPYVSG